MPAVDSASSDRARFEATFGFTAGATVGEASTNTALDMASYASPVATATPKPPLPAPEEEEVAAEDEEEAAAKLFVVLTLRVPPPTPVWEAYCIKWGPPRVDELAESERSLTPGAPS